MNLSIRRDLGLQLLALYLLFVGPVVLATLAFDRLASQRMEADAKASDLAVARAIAQETNTLMESALQAVRQLATYPAVVEADSEEMEALFRVAMGTRPDVNLVYRLDADGIMLYHYPTGPGSTLGWDFSMRNYYQRARNTRNPLLSEGRISPTTEQPVATAVMPLWSQDGDFLGVIGTNIKLQTLSHTLAAIASGQRPGEPFEIDILDSAGQVIANPSPLKLLSEQHSKPPEVTQAVLNGQSGNLVSSLPDGEEILYSYVPIPSAGWGVIVSRPAAVAFATPRATHRAAQLTVLVFIVVGVIFWFALARQVIRPLERLAAFSQAIGRKQPASVDQALALEKLAARSDQIGHLQRSLQRMESAIQARLQELSTLLETSASVVSTLDSQMVLDRILQQVERLLDIRMCAIVALDERNGVFRAQASRGLSKRYTDHLTISPSEPQSVTLRAIRSGSAIQVSDTELDPSFAASRPRARSEGYRSLLAVPLKTQHAPPSALVVYRTDPHIFSEREIDLLTSFANHAAMAIENANLYAHSDMRLTEQTRRLEALIQSMQDGLILEDLKGRVLYANRRVGELVGFPHEQIIGNPVQEVIDRLVTRSIDPGKTRAAVEEVLDGQGSRRVEIALEASSEVSFLRLHVFDVTDTKGTPLGRGQILRDITRNREIDRMKSSLISTVSHELRTPLAAIKGYASTLLAEDVQWDPVAQREFLEVISGESDRLSALVDDLLDMSRIEAGNLIVTREPCDLEPLVYQAASRANPPPGDRLQVEIPADVPTCFVDPQRIEVVLRNLLENAAKYANDHSPICLSAIVKGESVIVRVEDQGPGIPAAESERIFESFYRVESGLARTAAGAGLGLAISQGFVRAHGGEIWLEPRQKGTCVAFSLPVQFVSEN